MSKEWSLVLRSNATLSNLICQEVLFFITELTSPTNSSRGLDIIIPHVNFPYKTSIAVGTRSEGV